MANGTMKGPVGEKMHLCIKNRVLAQDVAELVDVFKERDDTESWKTEFWGKWMLGAIPAYHASDNPALLDKIKASVKSVVATQSSDGYIGNYRDDAHLKGWDVWGRKYTLLGLLAYYDISNDKAVLKSAERLADHALSEIGPGKADIGTLGLYRGMASSSILEPMVLLYQRSNQKKYLDFANYIVDRWETSEGLQLIGKGLKNVDVADRFSRPAEWWSWENGSKAYEMMSCYQGLLELYTVTRQKEYLDAVEATVRNIWETEINIAGSGSAFECWYGGAEHQAQPAYHMMETCVTTTWMRLCASLLSVTRKPVYADMIERTFYNAFLASLSTDGSSFSKYCPLEGIRGAGEGQCGLHINCCMANGPRGFFILPQTMIQEHGDEIRVNFYGESEAVVGKDASKGTITLVQHTDYPAGDHVTIHITPSQKSVKKSLLLRIPAWSTTTTVRVNGVIVDPVVPGTYCAIERVWKQGDAVTVQFDFRVREKRLGQFIAFERGPVVLARDARFSDGDVDESCELPAGPGQNTHAIVEKKAPGFAWITVAMPLLLGAHQEGAHGKPRTVHVCDFSSAGNTWEQDSRYRVWLPVTVNVMDVKEILSRDKK